MDIVFFGSGAFGIPTLEALMREHTVRAVVTQPDKPVGRGKKLTPTPIGQAAENLDPSIPVFKPERINQPEVRDEVRAIGADAWVVIAYGQKLGQKLLADKFAINLHASLLPRWRGAAPINAAVVAGDTETGTSVIALAEEMDAGVVYAESKRRIEPSQTAGELHDLLAQDGVEPVMRTLKQFKEGRLDPTEQDVTLVTLAPKISKQDAKIDFGWDTQRCRCLIHGYNPWPSVTVRLSDLPLKIHRVESVAADTDQVAGVMYDVEKGLVACGKGAIRLLEIQPAGKKPMAWSDFVRGRAIEQGQVLQP
ncbi:MAG: methionyl-tRNA formyltransferase [Phycisphaera sp.]|nr:MAG: methionyl-tRNA formyltransferase [Phycisphaera sp.]